MSLRRGVVARGLVIVAVSTTVANLAAYLLSMAGARVLAPKEFGALGALLGLSIMVSTVATATQTVAARRVAARSDDDPAAVAWSTGLAATGFLVLVAVAGSLLAPQLHTSPLAVGTVLASVAAGTPGFAAIGVLQGRSDHLRFGVGYAGLGLARAGGALCAMAIHPTAASAGLGMLLGSAVGSAAAISAARLRPHAVGILWTAMHELVRASVSLAGLYALINLDVVLARHYLDATQSGSYAVGSLVAKIAFFLPSFVIYVLFPTMSASPSRRARVAAVGGTLAVGAAVTAACAIAAPIVVWVAGGPQYHAMAPLVWLYAVQGTVFAVVQSLVMVRLSAERARAPWTAWAACLAFGVLVWRSHASIEAILFASISVSVLLALTMLGSALGTRRRPTVVGAPLASEATGRPVQDL